jgi:hypothetical protein
VRIALALVVIGLVAILWGLLFVTIGGPGPRPLLTRNEVAFFLGLALLAVAGIRAAWVWRVR